MPGQSDAEYFAARLRAELEAAAMATCDHSRGVHEALAEAYLQRLSAIKLTMVPESLPAPEAANDQEIRRQA